MPAPLEPGLGLVVRVRPASSGAGASTLALAIADAADAAGLRARLLDAAAPAWSGLVAATATELGCAEGWRRGRRGDRLLIDRVQHVVRTPAEVPHPRPADPVDVTVLDVGWSSRELGTASSMQHWLAAAPAHVEVLVTRPHGLALSQTERAIAELDSETDLDRVIVIVVGTGRRSRRDLLTAGPLLRRICEHHAVLFAPALSTKALPGLGPEALPTQLTSVAREVLEQANPRPSERSGPERPTTPVPRFPMDESAP